MAAGAATAPAGVRARVRPTSPSDYRRTSHNSGIELELRAFSWLYAPLVACTVLWDALTAALCWTWLPLGQIGGAALLLPVEAFVVAAVSSYVSAVAIVGKTRITLDAAELRVSRGPLPWLGAPRLPLESVRALRAESDGARRLARWSLSVIDNDGHAVRLLHDASEREARYVASALRAALDSLRAAPQG